MALAVDVLPAPDRQPLAIPVPARTSDTIVLRKLSDTRYHTEHVLFLIESGGSVTWPNWDSVYSLANVNYYLSELQSFFPRDWFSVVVVANNLTPNLVPTYGAARFKAQGIGQTWGSPGVPDVCRYHIGSTTVIEGSLGVLDHEMGHAWGIFLPGGVNEPGFAHWAKHSTVQGQMSTPYSEDGFQTVKVITGDETQGFRWEALSNLSRQEHETFSDQDLYLAGLHPRFPTMYILRDPVYRADHTMSYSSLATFDHAAIVALNGARNPDYRTSQKRFPVAFVYVARDLAEVNEVYQPMENAARHFSESEQYDGVRFRFSSPFLFATKYRASVDARLADLDGNRTPVISVPSPSYSLANSNMIAVPIASSDPDGETPAVSCVPPSEICTAAGTQVLLEGLPDGANLLTVKAEDGGGKRRFAHFVVDVSTPEKIAVPLVPLGPRSPHAQQNTAYSASGSSSDLGHALEYRFGWGDGTRSPWSASPKAERVWTQPGVYQVRAQARCATHSAILSGWSAPLPVTVGSPLPAVSIRASSPPAREDPPAAGGFVLTRTGPVSAPLTVYYSVSGTAVAGRDYRALPGRAVFGAGLSQARIAVRPIADPLPEPDETVVVAIRTGAAYRCGVPSRATARILLSDPLPLAAALDWSATYRTGGAGKWFGQRSVTRDGRDAARPNRIGDARSSWMETTVRGPALVSFWWRVSSEPGLDLLQFRVDGALRGSLSGETGWRRVRIAVGSGLHALRWLYRKNGRLSRGQDTGWVDQLTVSRY